MERESRRTARIGLEVPASRRLFIWLLCRRQLGWILFAMATALTTVVLTVLTAGALRDLVDDGVMEQTQPIGPLAVRLIVLGLLSALVGFVLNQTMARIVYHLEYELRTWLFERIHARDPRALDGVATGQMVTRMMTDLNLMQAFVLLVPYLIGFSLVLLGLAIFLFAQSPLLTLIVLAAFPFNIYVILRMRRRMWGFSWLVLNRRAQVTTVFDEVVRGVRVVKAFAREDEERERLRDTATGAYGAVLSRTRLLAKFDLVLKVVPTALNGLLLLAGGLSIVRGAMTLGVLVVFLRYSSVFLVFARNLDEVVNVWQYARAAAGRIFEMATHLTDEAPGGTPGSEATPITEEGVRLEAAGVSFDGRPALSDLDVQVAPGRLVVVVGGPRSGKTTIASLVAGELAATTGRVRVLGADPTELPSALRRRVVRVLSEEPFLFGRTVRENLEMGAFEEDESGVDEQSLRDALWAAGAEAIVDELPGGLEAVLGDRGLTLSGGQRQRLALARALVRRPRVLVLDDALLAVNPALEVEILRRLRSYAPEAAVLYLSRRDVAEGVADETVHLPAASLADPLEVASPTPEVRDAAPPDAALAEVVSELPPDSDRPLVGDREATSSDEPPGIVSMLRPLVAPVLRASGVLFTLGIVTLVPTALFQVVIDAAQGEQTSRIVTMSLVVIALGGVLAVLYYAVRIMRKKVEESVMYMLRRRTFQRLTRLGIDFYDRELPGRVAARVVYDLDRIADFIEDGPFEFARSTTMLVLTFGVIAAWSPPVAIVAAIFVPILFAISYGYVRLADRAYRRVRHHLGEVVARFQEDFAGRHVIHAFGAEPRSRREFASKAWQLRRAHRWAYGVTNGYRAIVEFALELAGAVVLWRAGNLVVAGALTAGAMVALRTYLDDALTPIRRLAGVLQQYMVAKASIRTLREPFEVPIRPHERDGRPVPPLAGEARLEGVGFSYPGTDRRVLHDISLEIGPGEVLAIVGATGAGKSSVVKLLMRVYDPDEGVVLLDGLDVSDLQLADYRRRLGVVPQDAFCFRGTVASNIAYGRPGASAEEIAQAVAAVGATESLASIPGGLDGVVEEEGRNLTGAQRQLIGLARAWLVRPDVLILDEATSALDPQLETGVLDAVATLGCTTVVVTHRLVVAERADRIVIMAEGRIVDQGTPEAVASGSSFARLWSQDAPDRRPLEEGPELEVQAEPSG